MPTYDYDCSACGHRLEVMHGVHGRGPSACPVCGGEMRKAFAPPAVGCKGSGWAKKERSSGTKSKGSKGDAGHSADGASSEGSKEAAQGESKAAKAPLKDAPTGGD